jgi:hypothetical protein
LLALWPLSRAIALAIASTLTGRASQRESAATWWRLWSGRAAWQRAYAVDPTSSPTLAAASQTSMPR